jgi:hypothetical protein
MTDASGMNRLIVNHTESIGRLYDGYYRRLLWLAGRGCDAKPTVQFSSEGKLTPISMSLSVYCVPTASDHPHN